MKNQVGKPQSIIKRKDEPQITSGSPAGEGAPGERHKSLPLDIWNSIPTDAGSFLRNALISDDVAGDKVIWLNAGTGIEYGVEGRHENEKMIVPNA